MKAQLSIFLKSFAILLLLTFCESTIYAQNGGDREGWGGIERARERQDRAVERRDRESSSRDSGSNSNSNDRDYDSTVNNGNTKVASIGNWKCVKAGKIQICGYKSTPDPTAPFGGGGGTTYGAGIRFGFGVGSKNNSNKNGKPTSIDNDPTGRH